MLFLSFFRLEEGFNYTFIAFEASREAATPAGTARAEDPLWQMFFLPKLAEAVPAESDASNASTQTCQNFIQTSTYILEPEKSGYLPPIKFGKKVA